MLLAGWLYGVYDFPGKDKEWRMRNLRLKRLERSEVDGDIIIIIMIIDFIYTGYHVYRISYVYIR